jgi:hypothetical protein
VLPDRCNTEKSVAFGKGHLGVEWLSRRVHSGSEQSAKESGPGPALRRLNQTSDLQGWLKERLSYQHESCQLTTHSTRRGKGWRRSCNAVPRAGEFCRYTPETL